MKYISIVIGICVLAWWGSLPDAGTMNPFLYWRGQGTQLSGLIAIGCMSVLLILATRPVWLEQRVGGLDKLYRLHKHLGITTGIFTLLHWILSKLPGFLVSLQLITLGPRPQHGAPDPIRGLMRELGEIAFYAMIVFLIISLVNAIPYRQFKLVHKLGAVLALMALGHSIYLISPNLRWTPFGIVTQIICILGFIAVAFSLSGRIGVSQRYRGRVVSVQHPASGVIEVVISVPSTFGATYQPGQFALVTFDAAEGAHPFTIVHYNAGTSELTFAIKGLGDHTLALIQTLQPLRYVWVEGPYGRFILQTETAKPSYWIAGGIGITPFVAWLEALAARSEQRSQVQMIYCVNDHADLMYEYRLQTLAAQAGIQLTILERQRDGFLNPLSLQNSPDASYWFCGPKGMRNMLIRALGDERVHYENFEFR